MGSLFFRRSLSVKSHRTPDPCPQARPTLHALFTEAVGLSQKTSPSSDDEETSSQTISQVKNNLRQLEHEVKTTLKDKKTEKMSLFTAFTNQHSPPQKELRTKDPSPDIMMFAQYLYEKGYFKDNNFAKGNFDPDWFTNHYSIGYIKFAAQRFATDNQHIAKWLSGSALKQVAMFGCPTCSRRAVIPAKRLRKFFEVPENTVCSRCSLQQSCKFVNQSLWNVNTNNLELKIVMKVITSYALGIVQPQLVVPDEVKKSVSQLLKEVVKLSQTT
ncbi:hypothetical protein VNO78_13494 [Psophocarpus tetragonolobus]|uniref:Uncharacterized protein n=1 Tax=Psophocarpus tetragonolobus TaxID=3891 RepID=A0AAN9SS13_PSOTE